MSDPDIDPGRRHDRSFTGRRMRVAFVHFWTLRMRRGVETLVLSLANELAKLEVDVSILTAHQTLTPMVPVGAGVKVRQFRTFRYYESATIVPFYATDLIRQQYDCVIAFFADFGEGRAWQLASPFLHSKLILYLTFPCAAAPHRYAAYRRWRWHERAALIIADAAYTARDGAATFARPVGLLPSGTDPERFSPNAARRTALRRQLGIQADDILLLSVSALEERKGTLRVIEALPALLAEVPDVHYLILGEGAMEMRLRQRVRELELGPRVSFGGVTTELAPYYNAADIFVMLSDDEAGSLACLEAMSSALPVVVSSAGGFNEVVGAGSGLMVNVQDRAAIVEALAALAQDSKRRASMGMAARETVLRNFSWRRIAAELRDYCAA